MKGMIGLAVLVVCALSPTVARADPCTASLPRKPGLIFSGAVRYVGDGDSLCVGASDDPSTWIEVRLGDFDAPELHAPEGPRSKALLTRVALGRDVTCTAMRGRRGRVITVDRVTAICRIGSQTLGDLLTAAGAPRGGN